jgi:DNA-binding NarL/FixJ family response regulator
VNRTATPRAIPTEIPKLTPREKQILYFTAEGVSRKVIAKLLYISVRTVASHSHSMYEKLGARERAHAVAIAFRMGILPFPDTETRSRS